MAARGPAPRAVAAGGAALMLAGAALRALVGLPGRASSGAADPKYVVGPQRERVAARGA